MIRKALTVLLTTVLIFFLIGTVALADQHSELEGKYGSGYSTEYTYINSTSVALYINILGKASCSASILAYDGVDSVRISGYLQYYDDEWHTVKNWSQDYPLLHSAD